MTVRVEVKNIDHHPDAIVEVSQFYPAENATPNVHGKKTVLKCGESSTFYVLRSQQLAIKEIKSGDT